MATSHFGRRCSEFLRSTTSTRQQRLRGYGTNAKMQPNETSPEVSWAHVQANPLLLSFGRKHFEAERVFHGEVCFDTLRYRGARIFYELPRDLTSSQTVIARGLIDSMFVSYPPVTRVSSQGYRPVSNKMVRDYRPVYHEISTFVHASFKVDGVRNLVFRGVARATHSIVSLSVTS